MRRFIRRALSLDSSNRMSAKNGRRVLLVVVKDAKFWLHNQNAEDISKISRNSKSLLIFILIKKYKLYILLDSGIIFRVL